MAAAMESLYAVGPDDFMATRRRLVADAKSAGDSAAAAEIGRLRKPSVAAWAVNLVARNRQDTLEQLVDTGTRMRIAQSHLDTATLTSLRPDRDRLIAQFTDAAVVEVAEAGRTLSATGQQEIRDTVIAALASEDATHAVVSGQLTRALSYSGFGEVDLSEAVARTSSGSILTVLPGAPRATAQADRGPTATRVSADLGSDADRGEGGGDGAGSAEQRDEEAVRAQATEALAQAQARLAEAEAAVSAARERAEQTRERLAVVERQLAKARAADERALEEVTEAVRLRKEAEAAVAVTRGDAALSP